MRKKTPVGKKLLTVRQVAEDWKLSQRTVRRMIADGRIKVVRLGRSVVPQDITRVCLNLINNGFYAATKRQKDKGDPNFKPTLKVSTKDLGEVVETRLFWPPSPRSGLVNLEFLRTLRASEIGR